MTTMREQRLEELAIAGFGAAGFAVAADVGGDGDMNAETLLMRCATCRAVYVLDPRFPHVH